jgi:hypothetical protein
MLGLSLGKIVFTILVIVAVWRAWKLIGPLLARMQADSQSQAPPHAPSPRDTRAVDLVACPHCGAYVPRTTACPSRERCRLQRS